MNETRFNPRSLPGLATLGLLSALVLACASPFSGGREESILLEVSNKGWTDITVHVERGGARHRLGLAPALADRRFRIPRELVPPGETVRLLADPVGAAEVYRSPSIRLEVGSVLVWTLQNNLPQSALRVR